MSPAAALAAAPEATVAIVEAGISLGLASTETTVVGAEVTDPVGRSEVTTKLSSEE